MTTPRLLPIQQNYIEGMKVLLEIYYTLKSLPRNQWFSDKMIQMTVKLFVLTISNFSKSILYKDGVKYRLQYGKSGTAVFLNEGEFIKFLKICDDIHQEASNGTLGEAYRVIKSSLSMDFLPNERKRIKHLSKELYSPVRIIHQSYPCKIHKAKNSSDIKGSTDLGDLPIYHEIFYVDFNFSSQLVYSLSANGPNLLSDLPDELEVIESPPPSRDTSFCDMIRFIIAKYYVIFGSLERFKVCLNGNCKKLIFEKKLGSKQCCDTQCRMEYNKNRQSREKRLCRERQNHWMNCQIIRKDIKEKMPNSSYNVHKSICDNCAEPVDSGQCPHLQEKNSKAFLVINKYPQRARVMHKII